MTVRRLVARVVRIVLESPLHGVLSHRLMVLTVIGRRTGRRYTVPVRYATDGRSITVVAVPADRTTWWLNAVRPAPVAMRIRGRERNGFARVLWERGESDRALTHFTSVVPRTTRRQRPPAIGEPAEGGGVAVAAVEARHRDLVVLEILPTVDL